MSYLEMALQALDRNQEVIQAPPERILLCGECPWCSANPWTHYPELPSWCSWHFDYLEAGSQQCLEWREGEIPHTDHMGSHRSGDFILDNNGGEANVKDNLSHQQVVCYQCHHFKPNGGPNPRQGWGRCMRKNRGRYGCARACETALN